MQNLQEKLDITTGAQVEVKFPFSLNLDNTIYIVISEKEEIQIMKYNVVNCDGYDKRNEKKTNIHEAIDLLEEKVRQLRAAARELPIDADVDYLVNELK